LHILLFIFPSVQSLQILVYSLAIAYSHLDFSSTLIRKLEARGHTVDLIIARLSNVITNNGTHNARTVLNVGYSNGGPDWTRMPHITRPFSDLPGADAYAATLALTYFKYTSQLCEHVLTSESIAAHLSAHSYDLALISNYDTCPLILAHRYGIHRVVGYSPFPVGGPESVRTADWIKNQDIYIFQYYGGIPDLPIYIHDAGGRFEQFDIFNFADRFRNFVRNMFMMSERAQIFRGTNEIARKHYGADFANIYELGKGMFYELTNSHPLLEAPRVTSNRIKYIGGIGFKPAKNITDEYHRILASADAGVVLISFGSQILADAFPSHVVDAFVHTAKNLPQLTFIWRYSKPLQEAPPNLHTVDWLPQNDLLQSAKVVAFVSHMGMNSFVEATFAGVPFLSIPLFADQIHNAYNAHRLGMGVILRKQSITRDTMIRKMSEILFNETYRHRAREIASLLAIYPDDPSKVFVETVEFAAKATKLGEQFRLPGGDLPVWAHLGYDIILILYSLLLLAVYISFNFAQYILSRILLKKVKSD
ncbi:hypothetical protein PFISCL1PPCAC_23167, partial [Pristionchus fissidentatus]